MLRACRWIVLAACLLFQVFALNRLAAEETETRYTRQSQKPYQDVLADAEFAISQYNYRLTGRNSVGAAIADMQQNNYSQATVLHFCNTQAAKEILDLDPDYLLNMPCRVTVRENPADHTVMVDARLLNENDEKLSAIAKRVNRMLRDIVNYAAEE